MTISVVVAWVNPWELIQPVLEGLRSSAGRPADEIVVVTRHGEELQKRLAAAHPGVIVLGAPPATGIPELRNIGLGAAHGDVIAVTEDHCVPDSRWIATIEGHMRNGCGVVGGPVENLCTGRLRDWAAFLTEYAGTVRPAAANVMNALPGNNVAYRRDLVPGLRTTLASGKWESFYHQKLQEQGVAMKFDPDLLVYHRRPFDFAYFVNQRFNFCRSFAGMRCTKANLGGRLKYGFGSVLLPPLLLLRCWRNLALRRRLVGQYFRCLPLIGVYVAVGAFGEMVGYFLGAGQSLERVE